MTTELTYENYLEHYGIKGMKWGVRRKPGPDGTIGTGSGKTKTNKSKMSDESKDEVKSEEEEKKALRKKRATQVAIGTGVLVAAAGGAYLAKKAGLFDQKKVSEIKTEPKEEAKRVVDKMTNVALLTKGKDVKDKIWPKLKDNYPYTKEDYDVMLGEGRVYNPWG